MEFKKGTNVYSSDGQVVGHFDRIVIDPKTKDVTHLVMHKGALFTEDKLVPIQQVESSSEDRIILRHMADSLNLQRFEESHYLSADEFDEERTRPSHPEEYAAPLLWYPPLGTAWWNVPPYVEPPVDTGIVVEQNIPAGTVALEAGAEVISADGEHVGNIERVFTDESSQRATHLLISQGIIFKHKKLVPTSWVRDTEESKVELNLGTYALDHLPDYDS